MKAPLAIRCTHVHSTERLFVERDIFGFCTVDVVCFYAAEYTFLVAIFKFTSKTGTIKMYTMTMDRRFFKIEPITWRCFLCVELQLHVFVVIGFLVVGKM